MLRLAAEVSDLSETESELVRFRSSSCFLLQPAISLAQVSGSPTTLSALRPCHAFVVWQFARISSRANCKSFSLACWPSQTPPSPKFMLLQLHSGLSIPPCWFSSSMGLPRTKIHPSFFTSSVFSNSSPGGKQLAALFPSSLNVQAMWQQILRYD